MVQPRKARLCLTERLLIGHKESNQTNSSLGPLSARQRNAIQMAFRCRADSGLHFICLIGYPSNYLKVGHYSGPPTSFNGVSLSGRLWLLGCIFYVLPEPVISSAECAFPVLAFTSNRMTPALSFSRLPYPEYRLSPNLPTSRWLHDTSSKTISSNAISSKGQFRRITISSKRHFA